MTNVFGGRFAERWGCRWVCAIGIMILATVNALTPLASEYHYGLVIAVRIIIDGFHGFIFSGLFSMYARWLPSDNNERAIAIALKTFGGNFGAVVSLPITGWLCNATILGGWPSTFYLFSLIHIIWFALWCWLVYDSPELDPRISCEEKAYIQKSIHTSTTPKVI